MNTPLKAPLVVLSLCACSMEKEMPRQEKPEVQGNQIPMVMERAFHPNQYFAFSIKCGGDSLQVYYDDSTDGDDYGWVQREWSQDFHYFG